MILYLESQLKELRCKKKEYSNEMLVFMKNNSLEGTEFKVNIVHFIHLNNNHLSS